MVTQLKRALLAVLLITLFGCTTVQGLSDSATDVADSAFDIKQDLNRKIVKRSKDVICNHGSIGAIAEEFGTAERAKLWADLCNTKSDFSPAGK